MWHCAGRGPYTRALALLSHRATVSREPFFDGLDTKQEKAEKTKKADAGAAVARACGVGNK